MNGNISLNSARSGENVEQVETLDQRLKKLIDVERYLATNSQQQVPIPPSPDRLAHEYVDYEYLLASTNNQGPYQTRLLYSFVFLTMLISMYCSQLVYLFIPPQLACETKKAENLLYSFQNDFEPDARVEFESLEDLPRTKQIELPDQQEANQSICTTTENGICITKLVYLDDITRENANSEFRLFCNRRPLVTVIKAGVIIAGTVGGILSSLRLPTHKSILGLTFLFAGCCLAYSGLFLTEPSEDPKHIELQSSKKREVLHLFNQQNGYNPYSLRNLVEFTWILHQMEKSIERFVMGGNLYWFTSFYWGAAFACGGLVVALNSYIGDFYSASGQREVTNNISMAFSFAQLICALAKMVVPDWRRFNFFFLGVPLLIACIVIKFMYLDSPKQMVRSLISVCKALKQDSVGQENPKGANWNNDQSRCEKSSKMSLAQQRQLSTQRVELIERIEETCNRLASMNGTTFLTHEQTTEAIERLVNCALEESEQPSSSVKKFSNVIGVGYLSLVTTLLYVTPYFVVQQIGSSIRKNCIINRAFNLFMYGLSEILGLILTTRFIDTCVPIKTLKYNLLVCGIAGFAITFSQFDDHCDQQAYLCPKMVEMIGLLIICQMRFVIVYSLFVLQKSASTHFTHSSQKLLNLTYSISFGFALVPLLWEYTIVPVEKVVIMIATLAITGSWMTGTLR